MSAIQRDIWHADRFGEGTGYLLAFGLTLTGLVRADALRAAASAVVDRHPVLSSRFTTSAGAPVARLGPMSPADWWEPVETPVAGGPAALLAHGGPPCLDVDGDRPLFRIRVAPAVDGTGLLLAGVFHHLVFDGPSRDLFVRDLLEQYAAGVTGRPPQRPTPPSYVDAVTELPPAEPTGDWREVAAWSTDPARLDDGGAGAADGGTPVAEFRYDRAALAGPPGTTAHVVLVASFVALLDRYTGDGFPPVAIPLGTRTDRFADTIGVFANELPLRLRPQPTDTFTDLLARTADRLADLRRLRAVPLGELRRLAGIRSAARPATVVFGYRRGLPIGPAPDGIEVIYHPYLPAGGPRADVEIQLVDDGSRVTGRLLGRPDRYDSGWTRRLAAHWTELLDRVLAEPDRPLAELDTLPAAERATVVAMSTGPVRDYPGPPTLTELIAEQMGRTPDAPAVIADGRSVSYADLDRRADAMAERLRNAGAGAGSGAPGSGAPVAVLLPRSVDLIVALVAALRTGAGCLPLDPDQPSQRLEQLLADSGCDLLVTGDETGTPVIVVDHRSCRGASDPGDTPAIPSGGPPDATAYVLYTSGSTGVPKAVTVGHRAIRNRLLWAQERYRLTPADRVLHKTSIGFDVSMWEVFWPLICGTPIVLARHGGHRDPGYLIDLITSSRVSTVHFVPSMLRAFLADSRVVECRDALTRVLCSGEELAPDLVERFHQQLAGVELHNLYGPTEAAIDVTAIECPPGTDRVTIGRPIANAEVLVLDQRLRPRPIGVVGEIYLGGVPLALGYRGRPDLTAERFRPDPAGPPGRLLYRTGDLGRYLPDGTLDYLGRIDRQVKIRGQRVELGEIEATVLACPGIKDVTVVLDRPDADPDTEPGVDPDAELGSAAGSGRLLAYYVPAGTAAPDPADLLRWLRERLPGVMVPAAVLPLDMLPLTTSGKIDRAALPRPKPVVGPAAPVGETEQMIAEIWAEMLGLSGIGADDDVFALGADSLLVIRVLSRIHHRYGVDLAFRVVFDRPTVAGLAAAVDAERAVQARPVHDGEA